MNVHVLTKKRIKNRKRFVFHNVDFVYFNPIGEYYGIRERIEKQSKEYIFKLEEIAIFQIWE